MVNCSRFSSDRFGDEPPNFVSAESVLDNPVPPEAAPFDDDLLSFASAADLDDDCFSDDCFGDVFESEAAARARATDEASSGRLEFVEATAAAALQATLGKKRGKALRPQAASQPASQASGCPNSQPSVGKRKSSVRRSSHGNVIPESEDYEPARKKRREPAVTLGASQPFCPLSPGELVCPLSPTERSIIAAGDGALLFREALRKLCDSMERTELSRRQVAMQRAAMDLDQLPPQARPQEQVQRAASLQRQRHVDAGPAPPHAAFLSGSRDTPMKELDTMVKELDRTRVELQRMQMFIDSLATRSLTS